MTLIPMSWRSTIRRLEKRYESDPSVLAIAHGIKFVRGSAAETDAIVFFVSRKLRRPSKPFPSFVCDVGTGGSINRSLRYPTDVREIREAVPRSSGRRINRSLTQGPGPIEKGTVSLAFLAGSPPRVMILSCAHVVADVWSRRPLAAYRLRGLGNDRKPYSGEPTCRTLVRQTGRGLVLPFDAGIGVVVSNGENVPRWSIPRARRTLRGLYPGPIRLRMSLTILGAATGRAVTGTVSAMRFSATLQYPFGSQERSVRVSNLYELDGFAPLDGDSGGIVYRNAEAVGFVVGSFFDARLRRGTTVFHRLSSAASHLRSLKGGEAAGAILHPIG